MLPDVDLIFSDKHHLALQESARNQHRQLQAQAVRVLAKIEAAEQAVRVQEEARRPTRHSSPGPRRGLLARLGSWFGARTPIPATPEPQYDPTHDNAERVVAETSRLLSQRREEIAKVLEGDRLAVVEPSTKQPVTRLVVTAPAPESVDDDIPPTRWG